MSGVARETVSRWKADPNFQIECDAALAAACRGSAWWRAELASATRAARGNTRDWELYLEHGGPTSWRGPSSGVLEAPGATAQSAAIVNIYGIPQPGDRTTLPPPIMRDATGAIVPIPPAATLPLVPSTITVNQELPR